MVSKSGIISMASLVPFLLMAIFSSVFSSFLASYLSMAAEAPSAKMIRRPSAEVAFVLRLSA